MVAVDPLAALGIDASTVLLAEHTFRVEGHSAADWIAVILGGTAHQVLPNWIEGSHEQWLFSEMFLDGVISDQDTNDVIMELMGVAAGRPGWWAVNLISMAASDNDVWATLHGRLMLGGVRATEISLGAWIDALYSCCVDHMDAEGRMKFDTQLGMPPAGTPLDEESEGEAFMNLMGGLMEDM